MITDSSINDVLNRNDPGRFVYAPNYWQWFAHHRNHRTLPEEIAHCQSQAEMIEYLGLDIFSRNVYCNEQDYWFGGLADVEWEGVDFEQQERYEGKDRIIEKIYHTPHGVLTERLRYVFSESTLAQEKFLVDDYTTQADALEDVLRARRWCFNYDRYEQELARLPAGAVICAGELFSPLKMLHLALGPMQTVFLLNDDEVRAKELMMIHEKSHLDLTQQMVLAGVPTVMAMDNLDVMFHPPGYVEEYCASFYSQASRICHEQDAVFMIHACGRQKDNLKLVSELGVDGLEGMAFPPVGDVELDEAMATTNDRFILTGGITALEFERLKCKEAIFAYVWKLFERMRSYTHRFIFSASCNTPITASWEAIKHFRDAWDEYKEIDY